MAPIIALIQAGLDSLGAVELRNGIAAKFGIALPSTVAFDYPTPKALALCIAQKLHPAGDSPAPEQVGNFILGNPGFARAAIVMSAAITDKVCAVAQLERPLAAAQAQPAVTMLASFAARYPAPGAQSTTERFWDCLSLGADIPTVVPLTRWDIDDVYAPDTAAKKMCVTCAYFAVLCP